MRRTWKLLALLVGIGLAVACGVELGRESAPPAPNVVTEHRFLSSPGAVKQQTGGVCGGSGSDSCASGICLHVGHGIHEGYVCTERCSAQTECPGGFNCSQVMADSDARFCVPDRQVAPTVRLKANGKDPVEADLVTSSPSFVEAVGAASLSAAEFDAGSVR